jgi:alpha-tubulin suppressor-like RCC1 family protein
VGLSSGVTVVAAGADVTCAVIQGITKCWGNNTYGQLGDGTLGFYSTPVEIGGLSGGIVALAAADYGNVLGPEGAHSCALLPTGGVKCWGDNRYGQLGDGTTTDSKTPVDVVGLGSDVRAITAGGFTADGTAGSYNCALLQSGGVKCWGRNDYGQLGDGTTIDRSTPVDVVGLSQVRAIAAGAADTCALAPDGVKCWGFHYQRTPINQTGLDGDTIALAVGGGHACVLKITGVVNCWGENSSGQLGAGITTPPYQRQLPVNVVGITNATAIVAGGAHTCVLTQHGGMKCWGDNYYGQLGDGSFTSRNTPGDVSGLTTGVTALTAGDSHTCALTQAGGVKCWGANFFGQLGWQQLWAPMDVLAGESTVVANIPLEGGLVVGDVGLEITVTFPISAVSETVQVTLRPEKTPQAIGFFLCGRIFHLESALPQFHQPVTLTLHYEEADLAGRSAQLLVLHSFDANQGQWTPLTTQVDTVAHTFTVTLDRPGRFALLAPAPGISFLPAIGR